MILPVKSKSLLSLNLYFLLVIKNIVIMCLFVILLVPLGSSFAAPRNAELVLENIQIEPPYPKKGDLITITGDVYNSGIVDTNSLASIITAAYFVDGKLLYVDEIGNVKPGIENKIKISSIPIWNAEIGNHTIKVILDYHDTLNDKYDLSEDNIVEKTFSIKPDLKILLNAFPPYLIKGEDTMLTITGFLKDPDSGLPLNNKKITVSFAGKDASLITDKDGKATLSKIVNSFEPLEAELHFEGDEQYLPSESSLTINLIPKESAPAIIMKIIDVKKQLSFEDHYFEFLIFQDSYDHLIKKISSTSITLDSDAFWISLPPKHDYFIEIYVDGRFLFLTDKKQLNEDSIVVDELVIPESAEIRFRVINDLGEPQSNVTVNNWIYSTATNENGFTDWIDVIPTFSANEPYVAEVVLDDNVSLQSDPFLVFSGERKTVDIIIQIPIDYKIPAWIKNNAGWWADGSIDDSSFVQGIQFLIKEGILRI